MLREAVVKKKRIEQVNAVKLSSRDDLGEIDAVSSNAAKARTGLVCANHLRFPGNCYRCFEPERCLLKDVIVPKKEQGCLLYTSPSPRDLSTSRMPSSA